MGMILRPGMLLAFGRLLTGVVVALVTRKIVAGMLTGISPADPGIMVRAAAFLCLVALAASFLPARRVTQVDPMRAARGIATGTLRARGEQNGFPVFCVLLAVFGLCYSSGLAGWFPDSAIRK